MGLIKYIYFIFIGCECRDRLNKFLTREEKHMAIYCSKCGNEVKSKFCTKCGTPAAVFADEMFEATVYDKGADRPAAVTGAVSGYGKTARYGATNKLNLPSMISGGLLIINFLVVFIVVMIIIIDGGVSYRQALASGDALRKVRFIAFINYGDSEITVMNFVALGFLFIHLIMTVVGIVGAFRRGKAAQAVAAHVLLAVISILAILLAAILILIINEPEFYRTVDLSSALFTVSCIFGTTYYLGGVFYGAVFWLAGIIASIIGVVKDKAAL